ncbi:hypothetical protein [Chryseobacterium aquaticum]|uniref:hypothetical protein n=1 Tax=Chryseobacterium aquaticum TaxID=452084 RepID=UPI003F727521
MKNKIIGILTLFLFYSLSAQQPTALGYSGGLLSTGNGAGFVVDSPNFKKGLTYDEIQGTPYPERFFYEANFISDNNKMETAPARYNAYTDQIEFKKGDEVLSLFPENPFTRFEWVSKNQVLVKLNIDDEIKGYFYEIVQGKNSLYKKVKAKFNDFVPAANSYSQDRPANFNILNPAYYIGTDKGYIKNPKNKKEIIEYYPEKKDALSAFFKENKIRFDKEEDLKKLVIFLNQ